MSATADYLRQDLLRWVRAGIARTGRTYRIALDGLDTESLRELQRLLRDLDQERQNAMRRARICPWR